MRTTACLLILVAGCGTQVGQEAIAPQPIPGPQGPQGRPGLPGASADSSILSWGEFAGSVPEEIIETGGPVSVLSFSRFGPGDYRIVYDILTSQVGHVAAIATGVGGRPNDGGTNLVTIVSTQQVHDERFLTVDVFSATTIVRGVTLIDFDTIFSLVILAN